MQNPGSKQRNQFVKLLAYFAVLLCALPLKCVGISFPPLVAATYRNISQQYVKKVNLALPPACREVISVRYGNSQYGYFETREYVMHGPTLRVELVPPGYEKPLFFHILAKDRKRVHRCRFGPVRLVDPTPKLFWKMRGKLQHGKFSSNFFLLGNGVAIPSDEKKSSGLLNFLPVVILNRYGEIVWLHIPPGDMKQAEPVAKPMGNGIYAIIYNQAKYFEIVDYRGQRGLSFHSKYDIHHDFLYDSNTEKLLTFSNSFSYVRSLWAGGMKFVPMDGKPIEAFSPFWRPVQLRGDTILSINVRTGTTKEEWDSLKEFSPVYRATSSVLYGGKIFDYTHANSLFHRPGEGYLISIPVHNRLVFLSENFRQKWSVGPFDDDTFRVSKESDSFFARQHHVTLLENDNILLFDNLGSKNTSRILEIVLHRPSHTALAKTIFTPAKPISCWTAGSAFPVKNGNVLGFFPNHVTESGSSEPPPDLLIEFGRETGQEVAKMAISNELPTRSGYRATPLETIGGEKYYGLYGE